MIDVAAHFYRDATPPRRHPAVGAIASSALSPEVIGRLCSSRAHAYTPPHCKNEDAIESSAGQCLRE